LARERGVPVISGTVIIPKRDEPMECKSDSLGYMKK